MLAIHREIPRTLLAAAGALALMSACRPPSGDLSIVTETLPAGNVDSSYSGALETLGGTPPLRFEIADGALPAGLELDADTGDLLGAPAEPGLLSFTARATDANGVQADRDLSIRVFPNPPPRIITTELQSAVVGKPYSLGLQVVDGKAPFTWSLGSGGALPLGLILATSGVLEGSATAESTGTAELRVTDQNAQVARAALPIGAYLEVLLSPPALPDGYTDTPYAATFTATGGRAPYTFELVGGSWPAGLSLVGPGQLGGTPSVPGTWNCAVSARDASGQSPSIRYTVTVHAPPGLTTTSLPDAQVGSAYTEALAAAGGKPPLSFAIAGGALPAGLSLGSDGRFAGTPSATGDFPFTVRVTDANGRASAPAALTLAVR